MLVEDNPQLAEALTRMIEGFGPTVIHAENAEEALGILGEIQLVPDAMLIDYQLGAGQNGTDLSKSLTQRYGRVPTAIISAERTRRLRDTCKEHGLHLVSKPLEKGQLRSLLGVLLRAETA